MPATVITVSPLRGVAELDRMARRSLDQHGVVQLTARTSDPRQRAHLARIGRRLAEDSALAVTGEDHTDGYSYVTVFAAGQRPPVGWMGGPKTDAVEDPDGDYWSGPRTG